MTKRDAAAALFDAFGAGIYLLFGIVQLDLWLRRRERRGHLWLAVASGGALLVDLTGMVLRHDQGGPPWLGALNLGSVAAVTASLYELVGALAGRPPRPAVRGAAALLVATAIAAGLGVEALEPVALVGCAVMVLAATARAWRTRQGDAGMVAGGFVILSACLTADLLANLNVVPLPDGLPIVGFAALFVASARSLNARFEREHQELAALRHELEQRVLDRTRELEDANARLAEASRTDALTGLPNRRALLEAFEAAVHRSRRSGQPLAVVLMDLDHFKQVNDLHGHAAGDEALRAVSAALRATLRAQDAVGRWGGEEFLAVLPDTTGSGARQVAENLRLAVSALAPGPGGRLTLSLGVAVHDAERTLDDTLAAADAALYEAKRAGRDRVAVATRA